MLPRILHLNYQSNLLKSVGPFVGGSNLEHFISNVFLWLLHLFDGVSSLLEFPI